MFCTILCAIALQSSDAGEHPALLLNSSDIARIRHACGTGAPPESDSNPGRSGHRGADFQAVRSYVLAQLSAAPASQPTTDEGAPAAGWLPGELLASAFLHLADPADPFDTKRTEFIRDALAAPSFTGEELLEAMIALDWCWDVLSPGLRQTFFGTIRPNLRPLAIGDSPLEHEVFRERLAAIAAAIIFDADEDLGETWLETRKAILGAARPWFEKTLPTFIAWRGNAPVLPESGPQEELDTALAVEFAAMLGGDAWAGSASAVGRWMEHYLIVGLPGGARSLDFVRDQPGSGELTPIADLDGLTPLTAHLIAARTRDPSAATIADSVERELGRGNDVRAHAWRWVPIVFDTRGLPRADASQLPIARNLGSAIVFRGNDLLKPALLWIDAGQPILHSRQHFDAGAFWVRRGATELAVSAADERAIWGQRQGGGEQRLGRTSEQFDFAQFNVATIAHNAMLFLEPNRVTRWYGKLFVPQGGQTPREGVCRDFAQGLEMQNRAGGRLVAFGHDARAAYAAIDLSAAYDTRAVVGYTREFVWIDGKTLLIVDRARTASTRVTPIFVLNLPTRPRLATGALVDTSRVAGTSDESGAWQIDSGIAIRIANGDAEMQVLPVLPENRKTILVGGPGEPVSFTNSRGQSRAYVAGGPGTFERLVNPTRVKNVQNAWFRLTKPPPAADRIIASPLWGRMEIEAGPSGSDYVFATVLTVNDAKSELSIASRYEPSADVEKLGVFSITTGDVQYEIELSSNAGKGGEVRSGNWKWIMPDRVLASQPLLSK